MTHYKWEQKKQLKPKKISVTNANLPGNKYWERILILKSGFSHVGWSNNETIKIIKTNSWGDH